MLFRIGSNQPVDGKECCSQYFDKSPHLTIHGTCFGTKLDSFGVSGGLSLTTRHDVLDFDPVFISSDIVPGAAIAVVDDSVSPQAALEAHAVTMSTDKSALVSITPMTIDNTDLSTSLIGLSSCLDRDDEVESHLNLHQSSFGYSHDNCLVSKHELVANDVLGCSFILLNSSDVGRCTPGNSSTFAMQRLQSAPGTDEECPADCVHTKYSLQLSQTDLTDSVKINLQDKISSGINKDDLMFCPQC